MATDSIYGNVHVPIRAGLRSQYAKASVSSMRDCERRMAATKKGSVRGKLTRNATNEDRSSILVSSLIFWGS